jgi:hypothetical protein
MHVNTEQGPPSTWAGQHPPGLRVVLRPPASDRDEALKLADALADPTRR